MIELDINGQKYDGLQVHKGFLIEQIQRRKEDGSAVCILVRINQSGVDLTFSCGDCPVFRLPKLGDKIEDQGSSYRELAIYSIRGY